MNKMKRKTLNPQIMKFYGYSFFSNVAFFFPILILFFTDNGMTYSEIFILEMVGSIGSVIFEVPTGAVADKFGKRISVTSGVLFMIISSVLFASSSGFLVFLVARLVWAFGGTLCSGANTALLYGLSKTIGDDAFNKLQGNASSIGLLGITISSLIGGFVASKSLRLTFWLTGLSLIICGLMVLSIKHSETTTRQTYKQVIKDSFNEIKASKWILWLLMFGGLMTALFSIARSLSQVYMNVLGVSEEMYGVAAMMYFLLAAIAARFTDRYRKRFGSKVFGINVFIFIITFILIILVQEKWGFVLFGLIFIAQSMNGIIQSNELLKASKMELHSTVLSFNSLVQRFLFSIISPLVGFSLDILTLQQTLIILVTSFCAVMIVLLSSYNKQFSKRIT